MLRAIFGVLGLLIVLAIVGSLAKNQLAAIGQIGKTTTRVQSPTPVESSSNVGSMAGRAVGGARLDGFGATAGAEMPSAQAQIQGVQQSIRERTVDALQQGVQRSNNAQP
jgi:hypothetical protein